MSTISILHAQRIAITSKGLCSVKINESFWFVFLQKWSWHGAMPRQKTLSIVINFPLSPFLNQLNGVQWPEGLDAGCNVKKREWSHSIAWPDLMSIPHGLTHSFLKTRPSVIKKRGWVRDWSNSSCLAFFVYLVFSLKSALFLIQKGRIFANIKWQS